MSSGPIRDLGSTLSDRARGRSRSNGMRRVPAFSADESTVRSIPASLASCDTETPRAAANSLTEKVLIEATGVTVAGAVTDCNGFSSVCNYKPTRSHPV